MSSSKSKFAKLDQYLLVKSLGSGYTSKVKLAYEKSSNKYFAAKIIRSKVHIGSNIKAIKNEINLLSSLSHPNIVNMVSFKEDGVYTKKNGQSYITKYVILELADAGELFGYIAYGGSFEVKKKKKNYKTVFLFFYIYFQNYIKILGYGQTKFFLCLRLN